MESDWKSAPLCQPLAQTDCEPLPSEGSSEAVVEELPGEAKADRSGAGGQERASHVPGKVVGLGALVRGLALGNNTLALLDQAVVSATNFLTTILIGRWCG